MPMTAIKITDQTKSTVRWITAGVALFGIAFLVKKVYNAYARRKV